MRKSVMKGSFTIEAAFLFPLILTVIVMIIYAAFFLHDRSVLNAAAYQAALRGSIIRTGDAEAKVTADKAANEIIKKSIIGMTELSHNIYIDQDKIIVTYSGKLLVPAGTVFMNIKGSDSMNIAVKSYAKRKDPVLFVRECRIIENAALKIKKQGDI